MLDTRNRQAIFTSLKNAITTDREAAKSVVYDNHRVNRVIKKPRWKSNPSGFAAQKAKE